MLVKPLAQSAAVCGLTLSLLSTAFAQTAPEQIVSLEPVLGFDAGAPVVSVALLKDAAGRNPRIVVAHGDQGATLFSLQGDALWRSRRPARLVAGVGSNFVVYRNDQKSTSLTLYSVGADGTRVFANQVDRPSPVAPTTLQRAALAALGPARIDGASIKRGARRVRFARSIAALAALAGDLGAGLSHGAVAAASPTGRVELYDLRAVRRALEP